MDKVSIKGGFVNARLGCCGRWTDFCLLMETLEIDSGAIPKTSVGAILTVFGTPSCCRLQTFHVNFGRYRHSIVSINMEVLICD